MIAPYQNASSEAGLLFTQLMQTYSFCLQRTLKKYGLYPGQPEILFALKQFEAQHRVAPTQVQIANLVGVSRASAGVSLKRMEKSGFVKRTPDRYDSRCIRLELTSRGLEFARWCEIDMQMLFSTLLEDFEGDERKKAIAMLERMQKSISAMRTRIEG